MTNHQHDFDSGLVGRMRGTKVRKHCPTCNRLGPWVKVDTYVIPKATREELVEYRRDELVVLAQKAGLHTTTKMTKAELADLLVDV